AAEGRARAPSGAAWPASRRADRRSRSATTCARDPPSRAARRRRIPARMSLRREAIRRGDSPATKGPRYSGRVKFENEFVVRRPKAELAQVLAADATVTQLFPDTEIVSSQGGTRETKTRVSALGTESIVRFVFKSAADGGLTFSKICDGRVWR